MPAGEPVPNLASLALLTRRLEVLRLRKTPVRGVQPGPTTGVTRLQWADGTTLLVRSIKPGAMAAVLRAVNSRRHVLLADWRSLDSQLVVALVGCGSKPVGVEVLGLDQPD